MNTIRRPRRRPRVESINFRTLWWLLAREAALHILAHPMYERAADAPARRWVLASRWPWIKRRAEWWMREQPARRYHA